MPSPAPSGSSRFLSCPAVGRGACLSRFASGKALPCQWLERDTFGQVLIAEPDVPLPEFERSKTAGLVHRRGMDYTSPLTAAALLLFWMTRRSLYLGSPATC
jgi:hypothetical protein